jgi:hypothetical protein
MKNVLDVEKTVSIPRIPNLFSVFLEERKEKPEDTMNVLGGKRKQIEKMIKELQKELAAINRRVAQIERFEQKGAKADLKNGRTQRRVPAASTCYQQLNSD